jgi:hypothetical protein
VLLLMMMMMMMMMTVSPLRESGADEESGLRYVHRVSSSRRFGMS